MESVSANRLSRKNQRGVSPIIATILLVAITVVLAAVLYILVTGLLGGHTSVTSAITMTAQNGGTCTATTPALTFNTFSIAVGGTTQTVTTSNFGLSLTQAGANTATPPGATTSPGAGSTCAQGATSCLPSTNAGWMAVLIAAGGSSVLAVYGGATPSWQTTACAALGSAVTISGGQTILIEAGSTISLSQAAIAAFGANGATVTGSVTL